MSFRLRKNESASAGVRRITREEIDDVLELLKKKDGDPAETVHEIRKHFKKIRAVLRLVRDELGEVVYERDNVAVRDLGRRLSAARDAAVRVAALDRLREGSGSEFPAEEMAAVRKRLVSRHRASVRRVRRGPAFTAIARGLRDLRRLVHAWPLTRTGFACLEPGLRRIYRQGKKDQAEAFRLATDEAFHEWRKRSKDLRYHVDLLSPAWPAVLEDVEKALHELTDCLGDDHDFADLRRVLTTSPGLVLTAAAKTGVVELIDRRRSDLRARARPIGVRIYSEKPKRFTARLESYWDAWRS
jgi:CHAD domain-containing protein